MENDISPEDKKSLEGLEYCLADGSDEDVLGHLGDLFMRALGRLNESLMRQGDKRVFTLEGAIQYYVVDAAKNRDWPPSVPRRSQ